MKRLVSLAREHRLTAGMILFITFFYAAVMLGGAQTKTEPTTPAQTSLKNLKLEEFYAQEKIFEKNIAKNPRLVMTISAVFLATLMTGFFLDIYIFKVIRRGRRWLGQSVPQNAVLWGAADVFQAVIFMFFAEAVLLTLESAVYFFSGAKNAPHDLILMANSLLRGLLTVLFILALLRRLGHRLEDIGLTLKDFFKNMGRGVLGYIAALPLIFVTLLIVAFMAKLVSYEPAPQNVVQIYLKKASDPYLLFFTLFVAGFGPALEEIFFRGFIYKAFRQKLGIVTAMSVTSLIFALFHLNLAAFVPVFVLGMVLCYLYEETGSLVPSMTAHMLHNLIMVNLTLGVRSVIAQ